MIFIAKRDGLSIKVDYLSIIFDTLTVEEVILGILGLPTELFIRHSGRVKFKRYTICYQLDSVKVYAEPPPDDDNPKGLGCYLVLTGKGCSDLANFMKGQGKTFRDFFRGCDIRVRGGTYHLTRLDIAVDDKNEVPYFTIEQIQKKCLKEEFISKSRTYRFVESSFDSGDTAKTVYIGDGKSNISYRFYDKDKEICEKNQLSKEDVRSWKRTELQLRDEVAHEFSRLIKESVRTLGELAFDFLGENLRFVTENKEQSNKSRWNTSRFWQRFLGAVKPLEMQMDTSTGSLEDTVKWLKEGGALSAVKAISFLENHNALNGLETMETMLAETKYSTTLSIKLIEHLHKAQKEELIPMIREKLKL